MVLDGWKEKLFRRYLFWICRPGRVAGHMQKVLPRQIHPAGPIKDCRVKAAALQLEIKLYQNPLDYAAEMARRAGEAAAAGAQLVVFPEDNNLQLLGMLPGIEQMAENEGSGPDAAATQTAPAITLADVIHYAAPAMEPLIHAVFSRLAAAYGLYLMAGSYLLSDGGNVVNRAFLYNPQGERIGFHDKVHLMPIEREWGIARGERFTVHDTALGKLALPVCMDATYFETFRILERLGAEIVMLPIANPEPYNFWMALRGIWPRVQESPVYGIKSALVGRLLGFTFTGRAGIYAPLELTPRRDGVLAEVESPEKEGMAVAELDLEALRRLRADHPWRDTNETLYQRYFPRVYENVGGI
ncbi:MAG: nitrilase-related carbon-nitrogen hydrolase [Bacillota bacterium]